MIPQTLINAVNNITLICNDAKLSKIERKEIEENILLIQKELTEKYTPLTPTEEVTK